VTDRATAPKDEKKTPKTWTSEQAKTFLNHLKDDRWSAIYVLACGTGMREGEILGLRWQDVDLVEGKLKVIQTIQFIQGKGLVFGEPKSKQSKRLIILPDFVVEALKEHKEKQNLLKQSPKWQDHDLVFTTNIGTPISPRNMIRHFKLKTKEAGLPEIRFHDIRHYNCDPSSGKIRTP